MPTTNNTETPRAGIIRRTGTTIRGAFKKVGQRGQDVARRLTPDSTPGKIALGVGVAVGALALVRHHQAKKNAQVVVEAKSPAVDSFESAQ